MEISVKLEHDSTAKGVVRFRTTRWTVVMISAQSQAREGRAAFAELYQLYRYPLYAFARRGGHSPEDAQDLTQGFFLHLLEHRALTHVDRLKGKFRSFLLASFQNYLSVEARRDRRLKRGGDYEFVSLDLESAESRYRLEPVDYLTAETIFDARWAMTLVDRAWALDHVRKNSGVFVVARLSQLFKADAAIGTERGARGLLPAMELLYRRPLRIGRI